MKTRCVRTVVLATGFVAALLSTPSEAAEPLKPRDSVDREVEIAGRVTGLDRNTGVTNIQVDDAKTLVFQFTPESVQELNAGDRIVARATFSISPPPQLNAPAGDAPSADGAMRLGQLQAAMGQNSVTGTVQNLNRNTGQFDVQTTTALLRLEMRPATVQTLQPGQSITVDMGFSKNTR